MNKTIFSNEIYTRKFLQQQSTLSLVTRIIDRVEQIDGFDPQTTPIVFLGRANELATFAEMPGLPTIAINMPNESSPIPLAGFKGYAITWDATIYAYLSYYLQYPAIRVGQDVTDAILSSPQIQPMSNFPAKDSIKMIYGVVVVKLSN